MKITYFNKKEIEKRVRGVILGQKLTLNHPSLVDEGEETKVLATTHKRKGEDQTFVVIIFTLFSFSKICTEKRSFHRVLHRFSETRKQNINIGKFYNEISKHFLK